VDRPNLGKASAASRDWIHASIGAHYRGLAATTRRYT
jgi:hypothetical protein